MMAHIFLPAFSLEEKATCIQIPYIQFISAHFTKKQTDDYQNSKNFDSLCLRNRTRPIGGSDKTVDLAGNMKGVAAVQLRQRSARAVLYHPITRTERLHGVQGSQS